MNACETCANVASTACLVVVPAFSRRVIINGVLVIRGLDDPPNDDCWRCVSFRLCLAMGGWRWMNMMTALRRTPTNYGRTKNHDCTLNNDNNKCALRRRRPSVYRLLKVFSELKLKLKSVRQSVSPWVWLEFSSPSPVPPPPLDRRRGAAAENYKTAPAPAPSLSPSLSLSLAPAPSIHPSSSPVFLPLPLLSLSLAALWRRGVPMEGRTDGWNKEQKVKKKQQATSDSRSSAAQTNLPLQGDTFWARFLTTARHNWS